MEKRSPNKFRSRLDQVLSYSSAFQLFKLRNEIEPTRKRDFKVSHFILEEKYCNKSYNDDVASKQLLLIFFFSKIYDEEVSERERDVENTLTNEKLLQITV